MRALRTVSCASTFTCTVLTPRHNGAAISGKFRVKSVDGGGGTGGAASIYIKLVDVRLLDTERCDQCGLPGPVREREREVDLRQLAPRRPANCCDVTQDRPTTVLPAHLLVQSTDDCTERANRAITYR